MTRIAVLDDWQSMARSSADWRALEMRGNVVFLQSPFADEDEAAKTLHDFDIILAMRERTPFPAGLIARLPRLKMFGMTGMRASLIDTGALIRSGVTVCYTSGGDTGTGTAELALGLMLAAARGIVPGDRALRAGRFQHGVPPGFELAGKTLGLIGLGRIGSLMASYGLALGMEVIAWSPNLTEARARDGGAVFSTKTELLARSDIVSLHLVLSGQTRGIIGPQEFTAMKQGAILVNTSRAGLIDRQALIEAVRANKIFAALDVHDQEPVTLDDALVGFTNTVLTPHLGYSTRETFAQFYTQSVENALAFLDGRPIRVLESV